MAILVVESVTRGEKSYRVKAGGKSYYTSLKNSKTASIEQAQGRTIDAVLSQSYDGKVSFIDSFSYVEGPKAAVAVMDAGGHAPFYWPSVSNVWAAAIQAGLIKEASDLVLWAKAVQAIAEKKGGTDVDF
jgi:molybdopterin-guanine dinucleotide biosynthesis protein